MALTPESSNLPLYISALALLIAVLIALFFYKQFRQIKQEIQKLSGFKNQINALDDKINYVQENFTKALSAEPPKGSAAPTGRCARTGVEPTIIEPPVSPIQTVHSALPEGVSEPPKESPELIPDAEELVENAETDDEDTEIIPRN